MIAEAPIVYLNHDLCPECGNISLPRRRRNCAGDLAVVCVECGAAVERGAIKPAPEDGLEAERRPFVVG